MFVCIAGQPGVRSGVLRADPPGSDARGVCGRDECLGGNTSGHWQSVMPPACLVNSISVDCTETMLDCPEHELCPAREPELVEDRREMKFDGSTRDMQLRADF
jgi:hypothetical protein